MKILATDGGSRFLLADNEEAEKAQVFDVDMGESYPPFNRESILARGYWEEWKGTDTETQEIMNAFAGVRSSTAKVEDEEDVVENFAADQPRDEDGKFASGGGSGGGTESGGGSRVEAAVKKLKDIDAKQKEAQKKWEAILKEPRPAGVEGAREDWDPKARVIKEELDALDDAYPQAAREVREAKVAEKKVQTSRGVYDKATKEFDAAVDDQKRFQLKGQGSKEHSAAIEKARQLGEEEDKARKAWQASLRAAGASEKEVKGEMAKRRNPTKEAARAVGEEEAQEKESKAAKTKALEARRLAVEKKADEAYAAYKKSTKNMAVMNEGETANMDKVTEDGGKFYVYSEDGKKKLGGPYDTEDEAKVALKKLQEKPVENKASGFQSITFNLQPKTHFDRMAGKEYLVAPAVMITEGVHNGSQGPLYYPKEELEKFPEAWNHKPVVVYHPTENGRSISACDPTVISVQGVGVLMNTQTVDEGGKSKWTTEVWFDEERLKKVDNRVYEALQKGEMVEVSTGLFTENESIEGEWDGKKYVAIARNYRPDHLAILPDQKGACSIKDGAGLLRNEERPTENEASFDEVRGFLHTALQGKYPEKDQYGSPLSYYYVEAVFKDFCIYHMKGKLWKQDYSATDTAATLVGEPEEVVRVVQYRSPDGKTIMNVEGDKHMDKKKLVDNLIGDGKGIWSEGDRSFLMSKSDDQLKGIVDAMTTPKPEPAVNKDEKKGKAEPIQAALAANAAPSPQAPVTPKKEVTVEEYVANAPGAVREMLAHGLRAHEAVKSRFIDIITSNKRNRLSKEQLTAKGNEELEALAALASDEPTSNGSSLVPSYAGLADVLSPKSAGVTANIGDEEPLLIPSWEVGKK